MARYWDETPAGKKRRTIYGKKGEKRQDLADRLAEALGDHSRGLVFEGGARTLSAFLDGWLAGTVEGSVKSTTYESYERVIRCHIKPELGRRKLDAGYDQARSLHPQDHDAAQGALRKD